MEKEKVDEKKEKVVKHTIDEHQTVIRDKQVNFVHDSEDCKVCDQLTDYKLNIEMKEEYDKYHIDQEPYQLNDRNFTK